MHKLYSSVMTILISGLLCSSAVGKFTLPGIQLTLQNTLKQDVSIVVYWKSIFCRNDFLTLAPNSTITLKAGFCDLEKITVTYGQGNRRQSVTYASEGSLHIPEGGLKIVKEGNTVLIVPHKWEPEKDL